MNEPERPSGRVAWPEAGSFTSDEPLTALDHDVEIVIRQKPHSRKTARISVVTA